MKDYWYDPIGRQVTWAVGMEGQDDISDLLADILPDNMKDVAQALQRAGFKERRSRQWKISDMERAGVFTSPQLKIGPRIIGQGVQANDTASSKNGIIEGRRYYRKIDGFVFDYHVTIFLFKNEDGTLSVMGGFSPEIFFKQV